MNGYLNKKRTWPGKVKPFLSLNLLIIPAFLISFCLSDYVLAKVWYVDPADPNKEIQKVVNIAAFGDTVLVPKGVYHVEGKYNPIEEIDIAGIELKEGVNLAGVEEDLGEVVITSLPQYRIIRAKSHCSVRNLILSDGFAGISCDRDSTNITIEHNLIIKNGYGIDSLADNVNILNNTIAHNAVRGVFVQIDPNLSNPNPPILYAWGNIIAFNGCDLELCRIIDPNLPQLQSQDLTNILFSYNDFYARAFRLWIDANGNEIAQSEISNLGFFGPGNFSANPYFVSTDKDDYHLLSYSPCIDRGEPWGDYTHEPQPNGQRANLGFYGNTPQAAPSMDDDLDGLYDHQEGIGDIDEDNVPDWQDADTVTAILARGMGKISFHIQDINGRADQDIHFQSACLVHLHEMPIDPPAGIFPFEAMAFRVPNLPEGAQVFIRIYLPEDFTALGTCQYLALSSDTSWQTLPFEVDVDNMAITIIIGDGRTEDRAGIENGVIEHLGGLVVPHSMSLEKPGSCFLSVISPSILNQRDSLSSLCRQAKSNNDSLDYKEKMPPLHWPLTILCLLVLVAALYFSIPGAQKRAYKRRRPTAFFMLAFSLFFLNQGWAQVKEDIEITSSPNPVGSGARALGMGGAFIGVADDATAASWNPAGLKHLGNPEASFVHAYSSRKERYLFEQNPQASGEYDLTGWDFNYLSLSYPDKVFGKSYVISLSCQHLYDFSKRLSSYQWRAFSQTPYLDMQYQADYEQAGELRALSLASALMATPRLTLGLTVNIWSDKLLTNEWIENYHKDGQGVKGADRHSVIIHEDVLEKYTFSGLNYNFGLLWDIGEIFTLGAVYKSSFEADLEHTTTYYKIEEYPQGTFPTRYVYYTIKDQEQLAMPTSYGIGLACYPIAPLVIDLDIYRTEWGHYELIRPDGARVNPITGYSKSEAAVKPTHQVRLGAEYAFVPLSSKKFIPMIFPAIRGGIFYDPAPAPEKPDDYYGISLGLGLTIKEKKKMATRRKKRKERKDIMSIDMAYQYRWGNQEKGETIQGENSPADIDHHMVYLSVIYYW